MSGDLVLTDRTAVALLEEAERALQAVSTPQDADELWRKITAVGEAARLARLTDAQLVAIARLRLQARRRWGQLLGPAENRGPATTVTPRHGSAAERKQRERARKLAELPATLFNAHLVQDDPLKLSEAALLRMVRELERLDDETTRRKACRRATERAGAEKRALTAHDVKDAVEGWLPTPPEKPDPPAATAGPDRQAELPPAEPPAYAADCAPHGKIVRSLLDKIEPAVFGADPETAKGWHAAFGELADLLAELTDVTDQAIKAAERERKEGNRLGIEVR